MKTKSLLTAIVGLSCTLATVQACSADEVRANILQTPGAPIALTHCGADVDGNGYFHTNANAINRSDVFLISYTIRYFTYDHVGVLMGQNDQGYSFDSDLAPKDITATGSRVNFGLTEPLSAIGRVACRLQFAKFEGGLSWTYGKTWKRRLSPLPRTESYTGSDIDMAPARQPLSLATHEETQSPLSSNAQVTVTNAWSDTVAGNLIVHDAIDIHAPENTVVRPRNLHLTVKLANGEDRVFDAMATAAPTYQKFDPLAQNSNTAPAFEVDPKEDLGLLGLITIPANSSAHIVVSFAIGNATMADPHDYRRVILH